MAMERETLFFFKKGRGKRKQQFVRSERWRWKGGERGEVRCGKAVEGERGECEIKRSVDEEKGSRER